MEFGEPRFEKVDKHTIRIIVEKIDEVVLNQIIQNKEKLSKQKTSVEKELEAINRALSNIEKILKGAEELGIAPMELKPKKEKDKK